PITLVRPHHLFHVRLRLIEVDRADEVVVARRGLEARPERDLLRAGVVGGGGAIAVASELSGELADVFRAEADDDAGGVEIGGIDFYEADVAADVASGRDDELQQAACGGLRLRARVEARLLAHDG